MFKTISKLINRNKNAQSRSLEAEKLAKLIIKKNNLIIKTFANLTDNNSSRTKEYLKSLIMKELKTDQLFAIVFSGDFCFVLDEGGFRDWRGRRGSLSSDEGGFKGWNRSSSSERHYHIYIKRLSYHSLYSLMPKSL